MKRKINFIKFIYVWGLIFLLGTGGALILIDVLYTDHDFRLRAAKIRADYIDHQKQVIKQEVVRVVDTIRYKQSQSEEITKNKIKARVYEAIAIARHIYQQNKNEKPESEIQQMVVDALRPIRFENGNGYYFITRFDGIEILFADRPQMEGRMLLDMQDTHGKHVIQGMIDLAKKTGEGFYDYHWTQPGKTGGEYKKISYIKRFEPWGWLIGTGLYVDDSEAEIEADLLSDISRIRFGDEGYIFVNKLNGDALVSNGKQFAGGNKLWDVFNDNPEEMKAIFDQEYHAALKPEGDYIQYTHQKLSDPAVKSQKISFILGVHDLQWLVGAGVYVDDVEREIAAMQAQLNHQLQVKMVYFSLTVIVIFGLFFLFFNWLNIKLKSDIELLISFFKRAAVKDEEIDQQTIRFIELGQMAEYANKMLADRKRTAAALRENEEKLRLFIEHAPASLAMFDREMRYMAVSRRWMADYRLGSLSVIDRSHYEVFPEIPDRWKTVHQRCLEGAVAEADEEIFVRLDGTVHLLYWKIHPWYRADETVGGIIIFTEDITNRKRVEDALRASEEKYRRLAENSPDIIYRMSLPDGKYEYISPAVEMITGYPPDMWYAQAISIQDLLHSAWHEYFENVWRKLLEGHLSPSYEYQIVHKDRSIRWLNQRNVAVRNEAGELVAIEGIVTDITARKQAEEDLRSSHERFLKVLDSIDAAVNVIDMKTHEILFMNKYMQECFGRDMTGESCWQAFRNEQTPCARCTNDQLVDRSGKPVGVCVWKDRNPVTGKYYVNHDRAVEWTDGRLVRLQIATDITESTRLEAQLRQAQKMESVGRLAGGVAHDYNNMLSVILGYTELALEKTGPGNPLFPALEGIHAAAMRSIEITRQLLAFSRKQTIAPKLLDLNETVEGMLKMLRRLVGENIDIAWHPGSRVWPVYMDPSQLDQILVNLCVNARDAIADVGHITIETGMRNLDADYCSEHVGFTPGDFVMLAVSDDGCGMDKEIQSRLFEPFFTTKAVGAGTGLGLATVYGIVKQNNGFINVYSEPGQGTTFRIYLPRHASAVKEVEKKTAIKPDAKGDETVLVVEDEREILKMTKMMLERLGYTVLTANTPAEAIAMVREHAGRIHLLMTDVVMPEMNGKELSIQIHEIHADMKVLFMSGYTANAIAHRGVLDEGINFIQKPFSKKDLAAKLRDVLDGE